MTTSQAPFKLPPVIAASIQPDPLEALRSPQATNQTFSERPLERDSVAVSEFNDIALDDDNFSPIALTARPNIPDEHKETGKPEEKKTETTPNVDDEPSSRPRSASFEALPVPELMSAPSSHRKTASTTTIRSVHSRKPSLLINRLDLQESEAASKHRGSVDGHLKLQEEFARLQEKEAKEHTIAEGAIDWGASYLLFNPPA